MITLVTKEHMYNGFLTMFQFIKESYQDVFEDIQRILTTVSSSVYFHFLHLCQNMWNGRRYIHSNGNSLYCRSILWNYRIKCDLYKWEHASLNLYIRSFHYLPGTTCFWFCCSYNLSTRI